MSDASGRMAWYDEITPVWEQGADVRARFIARTYGHLLLAVATFVGIEVTLFATGWAERIVEGLLGVSWLLVLGAFVIVGMIATKVAHQALSKPAQYAALFGFVLVEAIVFLPLLYIAEQVAGGLIQSAGLVTAAGFLGLTAIAFHTRKDFSFLRSILMWAGFAAILLIVFSVIFGFQLGTLFAVAMIALAGGSILYDTSNVLHHYPADRHVGAALSLFASVAMLFYYVLFLLLSLRD